jgi:aldehyde:ferredoxin oxidoreductase
LNALGALPTRNLKETSFEHAENISGEVFAKSHLARKIACTGCPVGCIHIGQFRREFSEVGHEYETVAVGYDYELIFALGSFLGLPDARSILELIEKVEDAGLDAMSAGVALGWATEALEKGLISLDDTIVPLSFGELELYRKAVEYLAAAENDFYSHLGQGTRHASEVYGGEDFAMQIAGNEMPGYHTGHANIAGVVVGSRHSHLCNGGYSLDQGLKGDTVDTQAIADTLYKEELERCMLNSLVMCLFARKVYDRPTILKAFEAVGRDYTDEDLTAICQRILATKLRIKKAFGASSSEVRLPKRFYETPSMHGVLDEATTREVIDRYNEHLVELEKVTG